MNLKESKAATAMNEKYPSPKKQEEESQASELQKVLRRQMSAKKDNRRHARLGLRGSIRQTIPEAPRASAKEARDQDQ